MGSYCGEWSQLALAQANLGYSYETRGRRRQGFVGKIYSTARMLWPPTPSNRDNVLLYKESCFRGMTNALSWWQSVSVDNRPAKKGSMMKTKLVAAIAALGAIAFSSGASALPCSTFTTLGALQAAGSCTDNTDADLLLTFGSTTLPLGTLFELDEVQLTLSQDAYAVNLSFPGGFNPPVAETFSYVLDSLNTEGLEVLTLAVLKAQSLQELGLED